MVDRVAILADCQNCGYDTTNASVFNFWDFIHCYLYPCITGGEKSNIAGREGDPYMIQVPMTLLTTPINGIQPLLQKVVLSVVAIKPGENDFIVESNTVNVAASAMKGDVQNIKYSATRGYVSWTNDPFNAIKFCNDKQYNVAGGWTGYLLSVGMVLRYDYWNAINPTVTGGSNIDNTDIANDGVKLTNSWSGLATNGWTLILRCTVTYTGYDGNTTNQQIQCPMICISTQAPATNDLQYIAQKIYYDDEDNVVQGIIEGAVTRVRTVYIPNGYFSQLGEAYYGSIWADIIGQGGVYTRRFASSEYPSEVGSPFSDPGTILYPDGGSAVPNQYANGGLRLAWFTSGVYGGIVIIETLYDDTVSGWAASGNLAIVPHMGFMPNPNDLETDQGIGLTTTDNTPITT